MARSKKDTRQWLVESAEFIADVRVPTDLKESVQLERGKYDTLIVRNIPVTILNRKNLNGRIYSTSVLRQAINEARHALETRQLLSAGNEHPEGSFVPPTEASHVLIDAYIKRNIEIEVEGQKGRYDVLFEDWLVLNTQNGKNLRALFEGECSIGTSIRGLGDMQGDQVANYQLVGTDCVGNPSSATYTRMPVSESVMLEYKDSKELKEGFVVSSSSTNVLRDYEQAAILQSKLDNIGYGTVVKTSTKVDSETDPKTGAETSLVTFETETEDEVASLEQALMMAKNTLLNGEIDIDSVTIEKVKEEEPKEAVMVNKPALNEEGIMESTNKKYRIKKHLKEAEDKKDNEKEGRKFVLKTPSGFVAMDGNSLVFKQDPKEALHFIEGKEESGLVHLSGVKKILDAMGILDVENYYRKDVTDISAPNSNEAPAQDANMQEGLLGGTIGGVAGAALGTAVTGNALGALGGAASGYSLGSDLGNDLSKKDESINEANGSNTKFTLTIEIQNSNGSVEKENNIPVSGVELSSVINEVGNHWRQKSQNTDGDVNVYVTDTETGEQYKYNPDTNNLDPIQMKTEASITGKDPIEQNANQLTVNVDKDTPVTKEFDTVEQASVAKAGLENGIVDGNVMLPESAKMPFNEFLKHCHACGGDWTGMLLSGIKEINPEYFDKIPDNQEIDLAQALQMVDEAGVDVSKYYQKPIREAVPVLTGLGKAIDGVGYGISGLGLAANGVGHVINSTGKFIGSGIDKATSWMKKDKKDKKEANETNTIKPGYYLLVDEYNDWAGPFDTEKELIEFFGNDFVSKGHIEYVSEEDINNLNTTNTLETSKEKEESTMNEVLYTYEPDASDPEVNKPLNDSKN